MQQCEKEKKTLTDFPLSGNAVGVTDRFKRKQRYTPAQIDYMKRRSKCNRKGCGLWGHWYKDHNPDGSLKPGAKSYDRPPDHITDEKPNNSKKNGMKFHTVTLTSETLKLNNPIGPLLDDGAPYSGLGMEELKLIQKYVWPKWNGQLDPLPKTVKDRPYW